MKMWSFKMKLLDSVWDLHGKDKKNTCIDGSSFMPLEGDFWEPSFLAPFWG